MDSDARQTYSSFLASRRAELLDRIAAAASRSDRHENEVTLLAVSKTVGVEEMLLAHEQGYVAFGENRPQDLQRKAEAFDGVEGLRLDMIGNLQRNKINKVLGSAELIHSVSSVGLGKAIASRAEVRGLTARCLLEVNVSGELTKSGMTPEEVARTFDDLIELPNLSIEGLMTMAPAGNVDVARSCFSKLRELISALRASTGLELPVLSCGMSDDFEVAVEEGSTLVRLGRIVFDPSYADAGR